MPNLSFGGISTFRMTPSVPDSRFGFLERFRRAGSASATARSSAAPSGSPLTETANAQTGPLGGLIHGPVWSDLSESGQAVRERSPVRTDMTHVPAGGEQPV